MGAQKDPPVDSLPIHDSLPFLSLINSFFFLLQQQFQIDFFPKLYIFEFRTFLTTEDDFSTAAFTISAQKSDIFDKFQDLTRDPETENSQFNPINRTKDQIKPIKKKSRTVLRMNIRSERKSSQNIFTIQLAQKLSRNFDWQRQTFKSLCFYMFVFQKRKDWVKL